MEKRQDNRETAYFNGTVYTADAGLPETGCFTVRDGRFSSVGDEEAVRCCKDRVDLKGRCVIPGLVDSHCHAFAGVRQATMNVRQIDPEVTPGELGAALEAILKEEDDDDSSRPLVAMGIDLTRGTFTARDIDAVIRDRPVLIYSEDGHALLLNTKAMEVLGIDRNTKDPGGDSCFCRDEQGEPTGLVIEIQAMLLCMDLVRKAERPHADLPKILKQVLYAYASLGYTALFEAMSIDNQETGIFDALKELEGQDELPLRLSTSFGCHGREYMEPEEAVAFMKKLREEYSSELVRPDTLKLFADGTVEEHSALLFASYADSPECFGSEALDPELMHEAAELAAAEGFSVHIHAIGDKGVSRALDALCSLGKIRGTKTIAHNQVYRDEDRKRFIDAGDIFFQTTPQWNTADDYTEKCLGRERYKKQFPVGTMFRGGVTVSFGSDSCLEVGTSNAFLGIYDAVARGEKELADGFFPPLSEGIGRLEGLLAYTINGAKQLGMDQETGSISRGKSADFVILDRDIMKCPIEELKDARAKSVYFRGRLLT